MMTSSCGSIKYEDSRMVATPLIYSADGRRRRLTPNSGAMKPA